MPYPRPTLVELRDRVYTQFDARISGGDSRLRRSLLNVVAVVHAGSTWGLYGYLAWIARQIHADTAEAEVLRRIASLYGIEAKPATHATFDVVFTGENGVTVPTGRTLVRSDAVEFETTATVAIASGTATVPLSAKVAGSSGTTASGVNLTLASPIAGAQPQATVQAGGVSGVDEETEEQLRVRVLLRLRERPRGGALTDYVNWALEVPGVTRAWAIPQQFGDGSVGVTFVMDEKAGSIVPNAAEVQAVQDHIDAPYRRPVTAEFQAFAPNPIVRDFEISGLDPDTAEVRAAIEAELADLLFREGEPQRTVPLSHIREAISTAPGENDHGLVAPAAALVHGAGEISTMGVVTFS